ncbi:ceramide synthase 2-like isoform X2 [Argonauta hians]
MDMDALWTDIKATIWSEKFWFPKNLSWESLENKDDGIYHPQLSDLSLALPMAFFLSIFRICLERYLFSPIGKTLGIKEEKYIRIIHHDALEKAFKLHKTPCNGLVQGLAKQTDLSIRQVERWFRGRRKLDKPSVLKKFVESGWRCTFYSAIFVYGMVMLLDKVWLWKPVNCWIGYPHHHVSDDIFWFYIIEIGYYISSLVLHFTDVRRKDFWELFIHHIITLLLLTFSWIQNMIRVGTLVLVIHDTVDPLVESAKMAKYCGKLVMCDILFVIFASTWFITRLVIFPWRIVYSTLFLAHPIVGFCPGWYIYNGLLLTLQFLHIKWFLIICRVAVYAIKTGKTEDLRSETEENVSDENNHIPVTQKSG